MRRKKDKTPRPVHQHLSGEQGQKRFDVGLPRRLCHSHQPPQRLNRINTAPRIKKLNWV
jgi:hypothetical protein